MEQKKLNYSLDVDVVNYILAALNRNQIAGVQQAKDLIAIIDLLQNPTNAAELEKEQYDALKAKFDK